MKRILTFIFSILPSVAMATITLTTPAQVTSWMDSRHYDPTENATLSLPANSNGEATYYIDKTNGSDSCDGLTPAYTGGGAVCSANNHGPYKTINKAMGNYDGHKRGERILIRAGYYTRADIGSKVGWANLSGTDDASHVNTLAPYGDGEVVLDYSHTSDLGTFSNLIGNVWVSTYDPTYLTYTGNAGIGWAVMDWKYNSCRQAIGWQGTDNRGTNNRTTSLTQTTRNFGARTATGGPNTVINTTNFVGAIVWNITDGSYGVVTSVTTTTNTNDTLNFSGGLSGGTHNYFNNGDTFAVYLMDADGKWATVGNKLYMVSTSGNPKSRNLLANQDDPNSGDTLFYSGGERQMVYGLTIVGSPSYAVYVIGVNHLMVEKCRLMFNGKGAVSLYLGTQEDVQIIKNYIDGSTMLNWPRGRTYGGNGGWPDGVGAGGTATSAGYTSSLTGNIILNSGGEGANWYVEVANNIVYNPFSMGIYLERPFQKINVHNNVVIQPAVKSADLQESFYLDDAYFGTKRTYNKLHPDGINLAAENDGSYTGYPENIYNNIVIGCHIGIGYLWESSPNAGFNNVNIVNNTVIMNSFSDTLDIGFYDGILGLNNPSTGFHLSARAGLDQGSVFSNNMVIGSTPPDSTHYIGRLTGTYSSAWTVNNNVYSSPSNNLFQIDTTSKTFATWKSATTFDSASTLTDTPLLVRTSWTDMTVPVPADMYPQASSVAVDTAIYEGAIFTTDYNYGVRPHGSAFDIGSLEYGAASGLTSPYCGDGTCNGSDTCSNCVADCGVCSSPVNCVGGWGSCSVSCGGGTQTYTITVAASGGGSSCPYTNGATQSCNTQACSSAARGVLGAGTWRNAAFR